MGLLDMLGGGPAQRSSGMSPITMGLLGLLAYRTLKGKGRLADMLGTGAGAGAGATGGMGMGAGATGGLGGLGGLGGSLGGLAGMGGLGGLLAGGGLSSGLKDLLDRFRQAGHENTAQSWVSTGANQPIAPHQLEQALGDERLQWLMEQTGLPKDQLLEGLSGELPEAINKLTPEGRIPNDEELLRHG